jgi:hypothetical protein
MSSVTKYLLLVPSAYILYCMYEDYLFQNRRKELDKTPESESIKSLSKRFHHCHSTLELANIFKKTFLYLRANVTFPASEREEVVDCEVIESGQGSDVWWIYPYSTRNMLSLNDYQDIENRKEGYFSIFFWYNVTWRQTLKLKNTAKEVETIDSMLRLREKKCLEISEKHEEAAGNVFFECIRKSEGPARLIEKEFEKIAMMKSYEKLG